MNKYNFYAGPAILPKKVIEESIEGIRDFQGIGLSILEISHRSKEFISVMEEAQGLTRELLGLGEDFDVLYLAGGASTQFYSVPYNFLEKGDKAGYVDTGTWSAKAIKEAKMLEGEITTLASSKEANYKYIPKNYDIPTDLKYLHLTSNNTVYGTQYHALPVTDVPLVVDMSSDIFSKEIDVDRFGLIYAGAQKNLGPAGTTLVIVNKEFAKNKRGNIFTMLDYTLHAANDSMLNTPPVFAIYVCMLNLRYMKAQGGLKVIEKMNNDKAEVLYKEIDRNGLFEGKVKVEDRSKMNVIFDLHNQDLNSEFMNLAKQAGCVGLAGHRSVGGYRASIYNAMSIEGVNVLVDVMRFFEEKYG